MEPGGDEKVQARSRLLRTKTATKSARLLGAKNGRIRELCENFVHARIFLASQSCHSPMRMRVYAYIARRTEDRRGLG